MDTAAASTAKEAAPSTSTSQACFEASSSFKGARPGYIFTTGSQGTGYYRDVPLSDKFKSANVQKAQPAKGTVLLANKSIVKGLQVKAAADAKKRKAEDQKGNQPKYLKEMARYAAQSCSDSSKGPRPLVK